MVKSIWKAIFIIHSVDVVSREVEDIGTAELNIRLFHDGEPDNSDVERVKEYIFQFIDHPITVLRWERVA